MGYQERGRLGGLCNGRMASKVRAAQKQRRDEAKRLKDAGLRQVDIAARLGVCQKTVSFDLRA